MSKKHYMKPGIETVVFNNNDDNMASKTYLVSGNYNVGFSYSTEINQLHS